MMMVFFVNFENGCCVLRLKVSCKFLAMHYFQNLMWLLICAFRAGAVNENFVQKMQSASELVTKSINSIASEWAIKEYPGFLKSCFMQKHSWELMKYKFIQKITAAAFHRQDFVISFTGSSVAAGHDSLFNQSYPIVVGDMMRSAFNALDIDLISKNVALGNNPCIPVSSPHQFGTCFTSSFYPPVRRMRQDICWP